MNFMSDNNNSKQFSVEKFMAPTSIVSKKSNFYEGKTVFGGANASRAARLAGTTPYNLQQRHHLAPVLRVNIETSKRLVETSQPLSSSSQRILEKLEKAATPLQDARRIPSSAHLKDYFQTSDLLNRSTKRPKLGANPVFSQNTSEKTFQPKRWELKLSNKDDHKVSATETTHQLINSCDNKDLNKYLIDSNDNKSNETFGGKMMRKDAKREEKRPKPQLIEKGDQIDNLDHLTTAKPLTMPSSLPKFNFGSNFSNPKPLTTVITKSSETQDLEFKFSEPMKKTRDQKSDPILATGENGRKPFVFSSPLSAINHKTSNDSKKVDTEAKQSLSIGWGDKFKPMTGTWDCSVCFVNNPADKTKCLACEEPKPGITNKVEIKTQTDKSAEKWICVCLFQNIISDNRCKACHKERASQLKPSVVPSDSTLKTNPTVETIVNKKTTSQTNPKASTGWGNQFKPPSGSWSCSSCLVNNPGDKTKCLACEEPKPGSKLSVTTEESDKCESWQCFYCKHNNEMSKTSCTSCAKVKTPIATKADLDKLYGGQTFKFGITSDKKDAKNNIKEPSTGFKLPVTTEESPKPELWQCFHCKHNNEMSKTSCTSCNEGKTTVAPKVDLDKLFDGPTFKFGITSEEKKDPINNVKETTKSDEAKTDIFSKIGNSLFSKPIESTPQTTTTNTFVFGLNENKSKLLSDSKVTKPNEMPTFNFGQTNSSNLFANAIKPAQNSPSKQIAPTITTSITKPSPFTFGGFGAGQATAASQQIQSPAQQTQPTIPPPSFNFSAQPTFSFGSSSNTMGWGNQFKPPSDAWNCTSCLVNNPADKTKCMACEESKPKSKSSVTLGSIESPKSELWQCLSCKHNNEMSKTSCTSCAKAKTLIHTKPDLSKLYGGPTFKFGITSDEKKDPKNDIKEPIKSNDTKPDIFNKIGNSLFSKPIESTAQTSASNPFVFGLNGNKNKILSDSNASKPNEMPTFNFGGQTNSSNLFANATNPSQNSLSSNQMTPSSTTSTANPSPFTFGGFGTTTSTSTLQQMQSPPLATQPSLNSPFTFGGFGATQSTLAMPQIQARPQPAQPTISSPFTFGGFGAAQSSPAMQQMQTRPQQPQTSLPPPPFNFSAQPTFDFGSMPNTGAQPTGPVFQFSADQSSSTMASNRNIKKAKRRLNPT